MGNQVFERLGLEVLPSDDRHRHFGNQSNRFEIGYRIIGQAGIERRGGGHADMVQQQSVAIIGGNRDLTRTQSAASTADILDHDLLTQIVTHRLRDQPGHRIGRPPGRERHHDGDGLVRIVLGNRGGAQRRTGKDAGQQHGNGLHYGSPPYVVRPAPSGSPTIALTHHARKARLRGSSKSACCRDLHGNCAVPQVQFPARVRPVCPAAQVSTTCWVSSSIVVSALATSKTLVPWLMMTKRSQTW